jgi:hypothetical protein
MSLFRDRAEGGVSYVVYFRDSEECLHCIRRRAASESEARDLFTRMGSDPSNPYG